MWTGQLGSGDKSSGLCQGLHNTWEDLLQSNIHHTELCLPLPQSTIARGCNLLCVCMLTLVWPRPGHCFRVCVSNKYARLLARQWSYTSSRSCKLDVPVLIVSYILTYILLVTLQCQMSQSSRLQVDDRSPWSFGRLFIP